MDHDRPLGWERTQLFDQPVLVMFDQFARCVDRYVLVPFDTKLIEGSEQRLELVLSESRKLHGSAGVRLQFETFTEVPLREGSRGKSDVSRHAAASEYPISEHQFLQPFIF